MRVYGRHVTPLLAKAAGARASDFVQMLGRTAIPHGAADAVPTCTTTRSTACCARAAAPALPLSPMRG